MSVTMRKKPSVPKTAPCAAPWDGSVMCVAEWLSDGWRRVAAAATERVRLF